MPAHGRCSFPCLGRRAHTARHEERHHMSTDNEVHNRPVLRWRVVDIAVASVIGVASAFIYWIAALAYTPISLTLEPLLPGLSGIVNGLWLFAAPLAAVIVRKPGAAIYAEVVAGVLEALLGNQWGGLGTFLIALVQGAGAEIVFAACAYRLWNMLIVTLSGVLAAVACWAYTFVTNLQGFKITGEYGVWNLLATIVSGAVFAGVVVWFLYIGIAKTGALDKFASGREVRGTSA